MMGKGNLMIRATTGDGTVPVAGARVTVLQPNGRVLYTLVTDESGETGQVALTAPDVALTLDPNYGRPAWSIIDVKVEAAGFVTEVIHNVEIVDTQLTILPVTMHPLASDEAPGTENHIDIGPVALLLPDGHQEGPEGDPPGEDAPQVRAARQVLIPEFITVHLGTPSNTAARNVRVRFIDYIKNAAASEIYSTWPDASLRANIYAIMTFAINRVYTEWYPLRGFPFNITNSTAYDQYYRDGGPTFDSINRIVDQIFAQYVRRTGVASPYFTEYCNGTTAKCNGLSQWGTVALADQGRTPLEILRYYYPSDVIISTSTNIGGITESYPGTALRRGSTGPDVQRMQNFLNRIRANFPVIPLIPNPNGTFDAATENAVRTYQRTFNLASDGVIGRATWNSISFKYLAVAKLAELNGEGDRYSIGINPPNVVLSSGSKGANVQELQFILNAISPYTGTPTVIMDSTFGTSTRNAVIEFQKAYKLTADGVVGPTTWNKLYAVYRGIGDQVHVPPNPPPTGVVPYPGTPLREGSSGADVRHIQNRLNVIRTAYPSIPSLVVDGLFGPATRRSVVAFQQQFLLNPDGVVGPITWAKIEDIFSLVTGGVPPSQNFPGTPLTLGSSGNAVRFMQTLLTELRAFYPAIPALAIDGIFGPATQNAVMVFQRLFGLTPDGIIGPLTWEAIVRQRDAVV